MRHEDDEYYSDREGGIYFLRSLGLMVAGGLVAVGLMASLEVWQVGDRFLNALSNLLNFNAPPTPPKVDVQSRVIQQVREMSELTTAAFTMQAVVPTSQDNSLGGFVIGTTKLLYIAYGEVKAGVDLSQLRDENVEVAGGNIQVQLPPPRILDSKIDVNRSNVYDYNRGNFGVGTGCSPRTPEAGAAGSSEEDSRSSLHRWIVDQSQRSRPTRCHPTPQHGWLQNGFRRGATTLCRCL